MLIALRAETLAHLNEDDAARRDIEEALRRLPDAYEPNAVSSAYEPRANPCRVAAQPDRRCVGALGVREAQDGGMSRHRVDQTCW